MAPLVSESGRTILQGVGRPAVAKLSAPRLCIAPRQLNDELEQYLRIHRLGEVLIEARLAAAQDIVLLPPTGESDQTRGTPPGHRPQPPRHFVAVEIR